MDWDRSRAIRRAAASAGPPADQGTIKVTGRSG